MTVTLRPPASRICAAIWPKRENPIISTSEPAPSKSSSISSRTSPLSSRLDIADASGVSAIDSVTMATSIDAVLSESRWPPAACSTSSRR